MKAVGTALAGAGREKKRRTRSVETGQVSQPSRDHLYRGCATTACLYSLACAGHVGLGWAGLLYTTVQDARSRGVGRSILAGRGQIHAVQYSVGFVDLFTAPAPWKSTTQ